MIFKLENINMYKKCEYFSFKILNLSFMKQIFDTLAKAHKLFQIINP